MSKKADNNWGKVWSREAEMECGVALQHLASAVFMKWLKAMDSERYPDMVGLGQIHDYWNMMYEDMKAIYTLETLVHGEDYYRTKIIENEQPESEEEEEEEEE